MDFTLPPDWPRDPIPDDYDRMSAEEFLALAPRPKEKETTRAATPAQ